MRIAINASDLDHPRIDGTRIYIQNLLQNFGLLDKEDQFLIYHKNNFNPALRFPKFKNYNIIKAQFPVFWTQTRFAAAIYRERPDVLWMPMHSLPFFRPKNMKTVVTIHDLAFKFYPQFFPRKDLRRLNLFTDYAVVQADKIIAVSNSTKNDILKTYSGISEEKIKVIYHGYNKETFNDKISDAKMKEVRDKYGIKNTNYLLYAGALQPRKNLGMLLDAFEELKKEEAFKSLKLVIAGQRSWMCEDFVNNVSNKPDVVLTGKFHTEDLPALMKGSSAFILPSFYEGFGLPALEAMASGAPVVAADNSSLREIVGTAGLLFKTNNRHSLKRALRELLENDKLKSTLQERGFRRAQEFSWNGCAEKTLEFMRS